MRWTGEQAPPPLPPPRKRIGFPAEILLIGSSRGLRPSRAHPGRRGRIPLRATLSQIPLKSCGFPGAESARKRFFLRGASSPPKKSARSRRTGRRDRLEVERVHALSSSSGAALMKILVSDEAGCAFDGFGFRRRRRGALRSPTPPRVTGCERVATLSRSPGGDLAGTWFSDDTGAVLLTAFVFDDAGCF